MVPQRLSFKAFFNFLFLFRCATMAEETKFCGSIFETKIDHAFQNHVMSTALARDEFECQLSCLSNGTCQSFNAQVNRKNGTIICELNNATRQTNPGDLKWKEGSTYYGSIPVKCAMNPNQPHGQVNSGNCHPDYKGKYCLTPILGWRSYQPAHSCKHIRNSGDSKGDGEYWIDPEKNGNPLKVYCDMTTDGGGWLLVANFVMPNSTPPPEWTAEETYRGISNYQNNRMGVTTSALKKLKDHLSYTQVRFHCSKQQRRTFHVTTVANSTGEAVVEYISNGVIDKRPLACGSFQRMDDDNSHLSLKCHKWKRGRWGHPDKKFSSLKMYDHLAYVPNSNHWMIVGGQWLCDDKRSNSVISSGDYWKVYVR